MSITHEEARRLIQFKADRALNLQEQTTLAAHLAGCTACTTYARQITSLELDLRLVMKKQWNITPPPLSIKAVYNHKKKWLPSALMPTRKLLIGMTTLLFAFTIWQFASTGANDSPTLPLDASPNPTPSLSTAGAQNGFSRCDQLQYRVQMGDTLESLAEKFSLPLEVITELNHLENHELGHAVSIMIPLCTLTPTSTQGMPASTLTPALQIPATTPG